ncbi:hypothetical protein [Cellulomonas soli]|uniref:hypothetical protein n=1 Tax=Cellulomonas soli TaxID=931535 RepID=UPI0011BD5D49|nr:hypothetical protein [Cellulomonas soli]NYI59389.1 hypothetical protein [Cellulomonas soli]
MLLLSLLLTIGGCAAQSEDPEPFTVVYTTVNGTQATVEVVPVDPHCSLLGDLRQFVGTAGEQGVTALVPLTAGAAVTATRAELGDGLVFVSDEDLQADEHGFVADALPGVVARRAADDTTTPVSDDAVLSGTFRCP